MEKQNKTLIEEVISLFLRVYFDLETLMSDFIAFHIIQLDFSRDGEKRKEFYERFLDRASFQRKTELVTNIINDKFPQLKNKLPKKSLEDFGRLRNKIAHSEDILNLEIDKSNPKKTLVREYSRGALNPIPITYEEVKKHVDKGISFLTILNGEVKKMKDRSAPSKAIIAFMASKNNIQIKPKK